MSTIKKNQPMINGLLMMQQQEKRLEKLQKVPSKSSLRRRIQRRLDGKLLLIMQKSLPLKSYWKKKHKAISFIIPRIILLSSS